MILSKSDIYPVTCLHGTQIEGFHFGKQGNHFSIPAGILRIVSQVFCDIDRERGSEGKAWCTSRAAKKVYALFSQSVASLCDHSTFSAERTSWEETSLQTMRTAANALSSLNENNVVDRDNLGEQPNLQHISLTELADWMYTEVFYLRGRSDLKPMHRRLEMKRWGKRLAEFNWDERLPKGKPITDLTMREEFLALCSILPAAILLSGKSCGLSLPIRSVEELWCSMPTHLSYYSLFPFAQLRSWPIETAEAKFPLPDIKEYCTLEEYVRFKEESFSHLSLEELARLSHLYYESGKRAHLLVTYLEITVRFSASAYTRAAYVTLDCYFQSWAELSAELLAEEPLVVMMLRERLLSLTNNERDALRAASERAPKGYLSNICDVLDLVDAGNREEIEGFLQSLASECIGYHYLAFIVSLFLQQDYARADLTLTPTPSHAVIYQGRESNDKMLGDDTHAHLYALALLQTTLAPEEKVENILRFILEKSVTWEELSRVSFYANLVSDMLPIHEIHDKGLTNQAFLSTTISLVRLINCPDLPQNLLHHALRHAFLREDGLLRTLILASPGYERVKSLAFADEPLISYYLHHFGKKEPTEGLTDEQLVLLLTAFFTITPNRCTTGYVLSLIPVERRPGVVQEISDQTHKAYKNGAMTLATSRDLARIVMRWSILLSDRWFDWKDFREGIYLLRDIRLLIWCLVSCPDLSLENLFAGKEESSLGAFQIILSVAEIEYGMPRWLISMRLFKMLVRAEVEAEALEACVREILSGDLKRACLPRDYPVSFKKRARPMLLASDSTLSLSQILFAYQTEIVQREDVRSLVEIRVDEQLQCLSDDELRKEVNCGALSYTFLNDFIDVISSDALDCLIGLWLEGANTQRTLDGLLHSARTNPAITARLNALRENPYYLQHKSNVASIVVSLENFLNLLQKSRDSYPHLTERLSDFKSYAEEEVGKCLTGVKERKKKKKKKKKIQATSRPSLTEFYRLLAAEYELLQEAAGEDRPSAMLALSELRPLLDAATDEVFCGPGIPPSGHFLDPNFATIYSASFAIRAGLQEPMKRKEHIQPKLAGCSGEELVSSNDGWEQKGVIYDARYSVCQIRGAKELQQDSFAVGSTIRFGREMGYFAVFDGHGAGGEHVSRRLREAITNCFDQSPSREEVLEDHEIQAELFSISIDLAAQAQEEAQGGSTGVVCVVDFENGRIFSFNCGDSHGYLCSTSAPHVGKFLSYSPPFEKGNRERSRINRVGGIVAKGRVQGDLNMSRSYGDRHLKPWVSSTAAMTCELYDKNDPNMVLVIGSDGLFDYGRQASAATASSATEAMGWLKRDIDEHPHDNTTIILVRLNTV